MIQNNTVNKATEQITDFGDLFMSSLKTFTDQIAAALPGVVKALAILIIGWLIAKFIGFVFARFLKLVKFDEAADRFSVSNLLERANLEMRPSQLVSKFVYWTLMLLVIIMTTDSLGWTIVSQQISELIGFIPKLFSGIIIFVIGLYIASFLRDLIRAATSSLGGGMGRMIGGFVFYFIMITVTLTVMKQIGIYSELFIYIMLMVIGATLLAAGISYGIASVGVMSNMLGSFLGRKTFKIGQYIMLDDLNGEIIDITNVSVILRTDDGDKIVIPTKKLIDREVRIKG